MNKHTDIKNLIDEFRYMQEKDLDVFVMISGSKGLGKSNTALAIGWKYYKNYGLKCLDCGRTWISTIAFLKDKELNEIKRKIKEIEIIEERKDLLIEYEKIKMIKKLEPCPFCRLKELRKNKTIDSTQTLGDQLLRLTRLEREDYDPNKHNVRTISKDMYREFVRGSIAYDNEDIKEKIYNLPPYSVIHADEGLRFLMASDWMKSENKELKKMVAQCRTKHLIFLICIPTFSWVDKKYRNDMCNYWLRLMTRGDALLSIPVLSEQEDPWGLKQFNDMLGHFTFLSSEKEIEQKITKLLKHSNVRDRVRIPQVSEELYNYYLKYRDATTLKKANQEKEEEQDKSIREDIIIYNLRHNYLKFVDWGKKPPSYDDIVNALYIDPVTNTPTITTTNLRQRLSKYNKLIQKK